MLSIKVNIKWILMLFFIIFSCDESPPYVQIIYPVDGSVMDGLTIIQAEAYDNDGDGKITAVDFYIDGVFEGTDNHANSNGIWEFAWNVYYWSDDSDHTITARAHDYSNNVGQSNIVTVMVPKGIEMSPTLIQPVLTETIANTSQPIFTWYGLENTNNYEIEISKFDNFENYYQYENFIESDNSFDEPIFTTSV